MRKPHCQAAAGSPVVSGSSEQLPQKPEISAKLRSGFAFCFPAQGGRGIWLQTSWGNRRAGSKAFAFGLGSLRASEGDENGQVCEVRNTIKDSSSLNLHS